LLVALLVSPSSKALAGEGGRAEIPLQAGGAYSVPVTSMKGLRFKNTLHQQYDFSCGSAALATLLTYHYAYPVSEEDVFRAMYDRGDQTKIRQEGFSLLDMKSYLEARNFEADGYQADIEQLTAAGIPAIALVKENGYRHFVVVKGMRDGRVLVGDPSSGTRALPFGQFKGIWVDRILFVIRNKLEMAKFNADAEWRGAPRAPLGDGIYRGAIEATLPKHGPSDF